MARPGDEQEGALAVRPPRMFELVSDTEDVSRLANVPAVLTALETMACQDHLLSQCQPIRELKPNVDSGRPV